MSRKSLSLLLFWLATLLVVLAAVTMVPYLSPRLNDHVNDLGYHSLCPFVPYSTGTLLLVAGMAWVIRSYVNSQQS